MIGDMTEVRTMAIDATGHIHIRIHENLAVGHAQGRVPGDAPTDTVDTGAQIQRAGHAAGTVAAKLNVTLTNRLGEIVLIHVPAQSQGIESKLRGAHLLIQ